MVVVPQDHVCLIWTKVKGWIKAAMERGDLGKFDCVEHDVLSGQSLLWVSFSGQIEMAAVTQVSLTEKSKVCTIIATGGQGLESCVSGIKQIEQYAKAEGCDAVRIFGRKGWQRVLKDYRAPKVLLEKRL